MAEEEVVRSTMVVTPKTWEVARMIWALLQEHTENTADGFLVVSLVMRHFEEECGYTNATFHSGQGSKQ